MLIFHTDQLSKPFGGAVFLKSRKHLLLLILILVGILASAMVLSNRVEAEQASHTYDVVLDYTSVKDMADKSDESVEFWLRHFHTLGVDKLGLPELTLQTLKTSYPSKLYITTVESLLSRYGWEKDYPVQVQQLLPEAEKTDALVMCTDSEMARWIQDAFTRRCEIPVVTLQAENGDTLFYLTGDGKKIKGTDLLNLPLGLDPAMQELALEIGYTLIPRSACLKNLNGALYAEDLLASFRELDAPYLIITGEQIPGLDDPDAATASILAHLKQTGSTLAVVETSQQSMNLVSDSLTKLVAASGENAVRVFSMWDYIQWRYKWYGYEGSEEIVNCLYRAVYERNCRVVYLKMMMQQLPDKTTEYITEPEAYTELLTNFQQRMSGLGYTQQTIGSMGNIDVNLILAILMAVGAVSAALLLLDLIFPLKQKILWLLTALGCLGAAVVLFVMPNTGRLILSIGGGIVMPLFAMVLLATYLSSSQRSGSAAVQCIAAVLVTALICLAGGMFASAPLSDSSYMLEMELYRGVKFMQIVPLAGFACYFLLLQFGNHFRTFLQEAPSDRKAAIHTFMETPIRVKFIVFALAAAAIGAVFLAVGSYYMARTGHTAGATTTDLEMMLRNILEERLPARPRTKEFLIGYPCIMLYVWCRRKKLDWLSIVPALGAVIGLTSIVNTFLHIRTTFMLSLIRVVIGLGFGLVLGLAAVAFAELIYRLIKKRIFHV